MADEADVARLTKQIADTMMDARQAFQNLAIDLDRTNLPRTVERRLEGAESLEQSAGWLRELEAESAAAEGVPATRAVNDRLQTSFRTAKTTSSDVALAIRGDRNKLYAHGDALSQAAKNLDAGLKDVDALGKLSGVEPETTTKLRAGLNGLKSAAENLRAGTGLAAQRLDTAQAAAEGLANAEPPTDIHRRLSAAVDVAASTVRTQVTNTGPVLENLRKDVYGGEVARDEMIGHGVQTADEAAKAATAAASGTADPEVANTGDIAGRLDPELAQAINAGFSPGPAAGTAAPPARATPDAPRDPRLDYMLPPRTPGTAGQQNDWDNGR